MVTLNLITYGCGQYDPARFSKVRNREHNKPYGGLWSSPVDAEYGWKQWCEDNEFGDLSNHFTFQFTGNIFLINSLDDAKKMFWRRAESRKTYPDFARMSRHYDAIHISNNGVQETMFDLDYDLYGWDCESVLILNPSSIKLLT
jgi:hypothetical protein